MRIAADTIFEFCNPCQTAKRPMYPTKSSRAIVNLASRLHYPSFEVFFSASFACSFTGSDDSETLKSGTQTSLKYWGEITLSQISRMVSVREHKIQF